MTKLISYLETRDHLLS